MNWILKYKYETLGLITGGLAGWAYWYFVGCSSGTCPITSNPVHSALYGSLLGVLLFNILKPVKQNLINSDKNRL